jgi:protocatechuate 3,4-dioxygenase beta subunit
VRAPLPAIAPPAVTGAPLPGAVVEACQADAAGTVVDSAAADDRGAYRVSNLRPGATYALRVKLQAGLTSAHPASQQVR